MDVQALMALVLATAVLGLTPGPVIGAIVGRALSRGLSSTYGLLAGVFIGDLVWLLAAISGLGYIAATYSTLFLVIKYVGAGYLIYLGFGALRQAMTRPQTFAIKGDDRKGAGFISGLLVTLGNPKLVAFYVGFLPTFIDVEALAMHDAIAAAILVPTTFCFLNFLWALFASRVRPFFKSERPLRLLNFLSGGLLMGAGVVMMKEG